MIPSESQSGTITGADWKRSLRKARTRRASAVGRTALSIAACTNAACLIRYTCGRWKRPSNVSSTWPGGEGCAGHQPVTVDLGRAI